MNIFSTSDYGSHYNRQKLFDKLTKLPGQILLPIAVKVFLLYELLKEQDSSPFLKAVIIGTLGYLICPVDAIPDMLPGGYVDDIALMTTLLAGVDHKLSDEIRRRAEFHTRRYADDKAAGDNKEKEGVKT